MTVERIHPKAPVMLIFIAIFTCLPSCINLSYINLTCSNYPTITIGLAMIMLPSSSPNKCLPLHAGTRILPPSISHANFLSVSMGRLVDWEHVTSTA